MGPKAEGKYFASGRYEFLGLKGNYSVFYRYGLLGSKGEKFEQAAGSYRSYKKRIMQAFWTLYRNNRIEKVTVSAITKEAQIHRSTFYEYFSDVYELLDYFETDLLDYIEHDYADKCLMDEKFDFEQIFPIASTVYYNGVERLHHLLGPSGDPAFRDKLIERMKPYYFNITGTNTEDPYCELKMTIIFNTLLAISNYWYDHQDTLTIDEIYNFIKPFFMNLQK